MLRLASLCLVFAIGIQGRVTAQVLVAGTDVAVPTKTFHIHPVYPSGAAAAKASGVVTVEVLIAPDGSVSTVRPVVSIPLLDQAVLEAVSQWKFTPTVIGGKGVPVVMELPVRMPYAVQVGGVVPRPNKLVDVAPVYPVDLPNTGIEGVVIIELMLAPSGQVEFTRIVKSVVAPVDAAAEAAVRQWVFEPTFINGEPTRVLYNVTVPFKR